MSHGKDTITLINVLKMLTDFVRWGNIRAFYIIEVEEIFKNYFDILSEEHSMTSSNERYSFLDDLEGTEEEAKLFYR